MKEVVGVGETGRLRGTAARPVERPAMDRRAGRYGAERVAPRMAANSLPMREGGHRRNYCFEGASDAFAASSAAEAAESATFSPLCFASTLHSSMSDCVMLA